MVAQPSKLEILCLVISTNCTQRQGSTAASATPFCSNVWEDQFELDGYYTKVYILQLVQEYLLALQETVGQQEKFYTVVQSVA